MPTTCVKVVFREIQRFPMEEIDLREVWWEEYKTQ